jgi:hypothetical protein
MASKFAKRHYEAIAAEMQILHQVWSGNPDTEQCVEDVVNTLAHAFKRDNFGFDSERFKRACLPGANVRARS